MSSSPIEPPPRAASASKAGAGGPGAPRGSRSRVHGPRATSRRAAWVPFRVPRSTIALLAVSIVLPLGLFALAAVKNRADVIHAAELRVERTTSILHEHALKVFETHQLMIDQINDRLRTLDWNKPAEVASLHSLLAHLQALLPQVADIIVTDADGRVRADSLHEAATGAVSVADRDYFQVLKAADSDLPYVSRAVIGRQTNEPIFSMAARVKRPDGRFDGVVAVAINQLYFGDFYRDIEREYHHIVILARNDGSVLASEPPIASEKLPSNALFRLVLESRSNGAFIHPSTIDGVARIFGDERVGAYPVIVGFGITWSSALRPWWRNIVGYGLVAGLSSLALLGVSLVAIRRIALEGRATARWRRSAADLEAEISERAVIEEQLRQSQKMEAVGRLTGGIAHDFNNLLTVVVGSLDMLNRRMVDADPRHKVLVRNAIDGATRAAGLTARLLAFSRQQPLDPKPLDLNKLITGMSNLLERTLGETVAIEMQLAEGAWSCFADPNQVENAVLNLCVNAVDAMPKGGTLTVSTANVTLDEGFCAKHDGLEPGPFVAIAVADTGTGMPPEVAAQAFEPFFTTKPIGKGTGLGLSQVYGFTRQSGGSAEIDTVEGLGTIIRIYLPRLASTQVVIEAENLAPITFDDDKVADGVGATILIVEDDDLVREFSASALREHGYAVVEAATGPDALALLRSHADVALLFTDIVLKGPQNGREIAEAAWALRPDLPVLFTTGYTNDTVIHRDGRLDEGLHLLAKPFTTAALAARIAELLLPAETTELKRAAG